MRVNHERLVTATRNRICSYHFDKPVVVEKIFPYCCAFADRSVHDQADLLAVGTASGELILYKVSSLNCAHTKQLYLRDAQLNGILRTKWIDSGHVFTCSFNSKVKIHDINAGGVCRNTIDLSEASGGQGFFYAADISNEPNIFSVGSTEGRILVYDLRCVKRNGKSQPIISFSVNKEDLRPLRALTNIGFFSHDGKTIMSAPILSTQLSIWDLRRTYCLTKSIPACQIDVGLTVAKQSSPRIGFADLIITRDYMSAFVRLNNGELVEVRMCEGHSLDASGHRASMGEQYSEQLQFRVIRYREHSLCCSGRGKIALNVDGTFVMATDGYSSLLASYIVPRTLRNTTTVDMDNKPPHLQFESNTPLLQLNVDKVRRRIIATDHLSFSYLGTLATCCGDGSLYLIPSRGGDVHHLPVFKRTLDRLGRNVAESRISSDNTTLRSRDTYNNNNNHHHDINTVSTSHLASDQHSQIIGETRGEEGT